MTLEELFATVGASTRAGYASTGANLAGTAAGERADIRAGDRETTEGTLESEDYAAKQAEKNAKLRAAGAVIGFFLGGAPGAGLGSATMRTIFGGRDTPKVQSYTKPGMFYNQTRKDQVSNLKSTNDFIKRANQQFASDTLFSAIGDAFTASQFQKAFPEFSSKLPSGKFMPTEKIAPLLDVESVSSPSSVLADFNIGQTRDRIIDPLTGLGATNPQTVYDPITGEPLGGGREHFFDILGGR